MRLLKTSSLALVAMATAFLGACDSEGATGPEPDAQPELSAQPQLQGNYHQGRSRISRPGAVFAMTNEAGQNAVAMFHRDADGMLGYVGSFATGGLGTGDESVLGNQGAIAVTGSRQFLFVVNPASNDVSSFWIGVDGLKLVDRVPSGGDFPVSVTTHGSLVYVLNAAGAGSIQGFRIGSRGHLSPIEGSGKPLSGAPATGAAQIAFSRNGRFLAVSEKATNLIDIYRVGTAGRASDPYPQPSSGPTPFGLGFGDRDLLFVSEAAGGEEGLASASSYKVGQDGTLTPVTEVLYSGQTAACWAAVTPDGRLGYTANTPSDNFSGYWIARDGTLTLSQEDGISGMTELGDAPKDMGYSRDGGFLYSLNVGSGTVGMFAIEADGGLTHLGNTDAVLPAGVVNGLAVW